MKKKILMIVNYYTPYISGLTEVVRVLSENYSKKGYEVTVLCGNHDKKNLKSEEILNGVKIIRTNILFKVSKGMLSIDFIKKAIKLSKQYDIINFHTPMLEIGLLSFFLKKRKFINFYHCDLDLKPGILNNFIKKIMEISNIIGLKNSYKILVTTKDYALHSKLASKYKEKLIEVRTPIKEYYRIKSGEKNTKKIIGFCGRIVMEKGIDVLIRAYKHILDKRKDIELIIGGDYKNIAGGSIYDELKNYINQNNLKGIKFIGKIPEEKMAEFYSSLDVFVLPSVNPLEAFGMVQIEAMLCGTPVVSSNLYGVRTIVQNTEMGLIHENGNDKDLAEKILEILSNKSKYLKTREEIIKLYSTKKCMEEYEKVFNMVLRKEVNE